MQYFKEQLEKANLGDSKAMFIVGLCYLFGSGIIQDDMQGLKWGLKARDCGYEGFEKMMNLDEFYSNGEGVWLDVSDALEWYKAKVESGDPNIQYNLGGCYYRSEDSSYNKDKAVYYFRLAANQNHSKAQFLLGVCYIKGIGVAQDKYEAAKWWKYAASNGNELAIKYLEALQSDNK